jgi:hypothetical protein
MPQHNEAQAQRERLEQLRRPKRADGLGRDIISTSLPVDVSIAIRERARQEDKTVSALAAEFIEAGLRARSQTTEPLAS